MLDLMTRRHVYSFRDPVGLAPVGVGAAA